MNQVIFISAEMSAKDRVKAIADAWRAAPDGTLPIRLDPRLSEADLEALWRATARRRHGVPLLHLLVNHAQATPELLSRIVESGPDQSVLEAIAMSGRSTPALLDLMAAQAEPHLRLSIDLARFGLVLDQAPADQIRTALEPFADEPGAPAHFLAACHPRTPDALLVELATSDEDHVARAAKKNLSARRADGGSPPTDDR